jgi:hypothetical protein
MSTPAFSLNLSDFGGSIYDVAPPPPPAASAPSNPNPPVQTAGTLSAIETAISGLSGLAAPWFTAETGRSVIPLPTSAAQAALQQTQIQQQAQAKLLQTQPTTAGLLANPTVVIGGLAILALLFYAISKK